MKAANKPGKVYSYLHFFQGSDIPIKSQTEIHSFFKKNEGTQFVMCEFSRKSMAEHKAQYRHFFCHNRFFRRNTIVKALNFGLVELQKILKIKKNTDIELCQGSALFSITQDCSRYIIAQETNIRKRFRYALAADEVFIQTLLLNSKYREFIFELSHDQTCNARYIDRTRPDGKNSPHIWRSDEVDMLMGLTEKYCFARKFDEMVDINAAEEIMRRIKENECK